MEKFRENIKSLLEERMPEYQFESNDTIKNNDIKLHTIIAKKKEDDTIGINLYMERYYAQYQEGTPFEDIVDQLEEIILGQNIDTSNWTGRLAKLFDSYESVKPYLLIRLFNKETNQEFLQGKVYKDFLDMAAVLYLVVEENGDNLGTVSIPQKIFESWNLPFEEVYEEALKQTQERFPLKIQSLKDMLDEMMSREDDTFAEMMNPPEVEDVECYIVTNSQNLNGANVIFYPGAFRTVCEKMNCESIYLLPSSIHEWIALSVEKLNIVSYLRDMVREVNLSCVQDVDTLSFNIYRYDLASDDVVIVNE